MNKHSSPVVRQESPEVLEALEAIRKAAEFLQGSSVPAPDDTVVEQYGASPDVSKVRLGESTVYWTRPPVFDVEVNDSSTSYLVLVECKTGGGKTESSNVLANRKPSWPPSWWPLGRPAATPGSGAAEGASQSDQIASLRTEVEELKRQVAVLTGLVQLGNGPAPSPLAAAKARGASYMKVEFENPQNLTLAAASRYTGRSDRLINLERNRGALYALILEGNTRGYRYPKWQFDVAAARLRAVLDVLAPSAMSCWALHSFLTRPHVDLDNRSPAEALADGTFAIERVVGLARQRADLHQGAA
ncbi:hypothetical protein [Massilia sp. GCM10023247]|uniref:hypothetical protein n=1 Tax=Massilia sp. GCM10023247 TaxID=3252643 RepID=UPI0036125DCD